LNILYPRAKPYFSDKDVDDILKDIKKTLHSGNLVQGEKVEEFETKFASMVGTKYAIATNSCTSALELSIRSLGVENEKILVPTETFVATGNAVVLSNNIPIFTDIDSSTLCMSYDDILNRMTNDVAGIIIVHMGGFITPDIYRIRNFCDKTGLFLIEDAAHAHGAQIYNEYRDERHCAGSLGDVGCFSFYPTKIMTTGEGGMITTNSHDVMSMAKILRNHGGDGRLGIHSASNDRMNEISAILGLSQLKRLEQFVEKRNYISNMYRELLENIPEIDLLPIYNEIKNSYWNFYFILNSIDRKQFIDKMLQFGIQLGDAYNPPCHKQPVFEKYVSGYDFTVADMVLEKHISLPMYTDLTDEDIVFITDKIKEVLDDYRK
tara:strand:+ start:844 stop:1977 length:1134 start_codon:yes stop_codon:yes gene_type:complete